MNTVEIAKPNNPRIKNTTPSLSHKEIKKDWFLIDLNGVVLGRVASFISHRLMGKHKPTYTPHLDCGDNIVVINADHVHLTGNKENDKIYYHHTGYPGGIKSISAKASRKKRSTDLVKKAIKRMLGRGPLAYKQMTRLHVYASDQHLHTAQQPTLLDFANMNVKNKKN